MAICEMDRELEWNSKESCHANNLGALAEALRPIAPWLSHVSSDAKTGTTIRVILVKAIRPNLSEGWRPVVGMQEKVEAVLATVDEFLHNQVITKPVGAIEL